MRIPAPVPDDCVRGETVQLSVRPEKIAVDDEIEEGMVRLEGTIEGRVYLGVSTQITVALGDGAGWWRSSRRPTGPAPTTAGSPG